MRRLYERDTPFSIFLKNDLGKIFGGLQTFLDKEAICIDASWFEGNLKKQGYRTQLLKAAEREAIKTGCIFSLFNSSN